MYVDIALYEANKATVLNWFHSKGSKDIKNTISMMSSSTFVPAIVIAYWLGEETDWHPDAVMSIKCFIDFYGYTKIDNKPPGAPI